ncbi:solute carrier family 35 member G1-like [Brevipalpus obovatus]|uniref:solute carrier family 35 member G1-like n=1 Tax=Brevipalpus obovatus TaxID=246614 RepID=UPI003D9DEED2
MSMLEADYYRPSSSEVHRVNFSDRLTKIPAIGVVFAATAAVLFATGSLCVKLITSIDPVEVVLFRSLFQSIIYTAIVASYRESLKIPSGERFSLVARCVCGFLTACCSYYSIRMISLGDASTIAFSSPVFVSIFACMCLRESCGPIQLITALLTVLGVVLICKPPFIFGGDSAEFNINWVLGVVIALFGSLTRAVNVICLRQMKLTPSSVVIFYFSLSGVLQSLIVLLVMQDLKFPNNVNDILLLLGVGTFTSLGQYFQTVALKIEEAGPVSMARTLDIVMSFVYQITLLNNPAEWTDLAGAGVVCGSVIIVGLHKWYNRRPEVFSRCLPCLAPRKERANFRGSVTIVPPLQTQEKNTNCNHNSHNNQEAIREVIQNGINGIRLSP